MLWLSVIVSLVMVMPCSSAGEPMSTDVFYTLNARVLTNYVPINDRMIVLSHPMILEIL